MAAELSLTEEFLVLFNMLKKEAGNSPERVRTFYKESKAIRDALDALHGFLSRTDLERRVFHGQKVVVLRAPGFEAAWKEYAEKWHFRVRRPAVPIPIRLDDSDPHPDPDGSVLAALLERAWKEAEIELEPPSAIERIAPDPEAEDSFDPLRHDGAAAIELGIEYLESPVARRLDLEGPGLEDELEWANRCSIALSAYDYLTDTIGLDIHGVFQRWHNLPVILMPAYVANRYGASEKGSLPNLLDDAVRAYVFGAPAAAIAMCRAAYHMVKAHYPADHLEKVVVHASQQYDYSIKQLVDRANEIMHNYKNKKRLTVEDDQIVVSFLATLKFLIQGAPKP